MNSVKENMSRRQSAHFTFRQFFIATACLLSATSGVRAENVTLQNNPELHQVDINPGNGGLSAPRQSDRDVVHTGGREITVNNLFRQSVRIAIARDYGLRQYQAEWMAADHDTSATQGERWPQLAVNAMVLPIDRGNGNNKTYANDGNLSASVSMPLFDWGRLSSAIESREYTAIAAGERYLSQLDSLAFDVTSTQVKLAKQQAIYYVAQNYAKRMDELVTMLGLIVQTDPGRRSELTQARARLLQANEERDNAAAEIRQLETAMEKWLGETPGEAMPVDSAWIMDMPPLNNAMNNIRNTPAMREALAQYQAQMAKAAEEKARQLPSVNFVVSKGFASGNYGENTDMQAGVSVSWDVFNGFSGMEKIAAAEQRAVSAKEGSAQNQRDIESKIKVQYDEISRQRNRSQSYEALSLESDHIRWMFYQQWYHLGKRSLLDVLIAESDHYGNQINAISSRFDGYIGVLTLRRDSGMLLSWLDNEWSKPQLNNNTLPAF